MHVQHPQCCQHAIDLLQWHTEVGPIDFVPPPHLIKEASAAQLSPQRNGQKIPVFQMPFHVSLAIAHHDQLQCNTSGHTGHPLSTVMCMPVTSNQGPLYPTCYQPNSCYRWILTCLRSFITSCGTASIALPCGPASQAARILLPKQKKWHMVVTSACTRYSSPLKAKTFRVSLPLLIRYSSVCTPSAPMGTPFLGLFFASAIRWYHQAPLAMFLW